MRRCPRAPGRHVRAAGLRLHLGAPAFYVESLDALLLTRRQRLLQAAADPWAEWLATSVVAFAFLSLGTDSDVAAIFHRFVVVNTFVIANNLLPFAGLDGALLFADAVGRPDLPFRTSTALRRSSSGERWIIVYSVLNALVAAGLFIVAGYFWWQLSVESPQRCGHMDQ
jgi:Zn-dependent protease